MRVSLCLLFCALCAGQRIARIETGAGNPANANYAAQFGIDLEDIYTSNNNVNTPQWAAPREAQMAAPFGSRILYLFWNDAAATTLSDANGNTANTDSSRVLNAVNRMYIYYEDPTGAITPANTRIKLEAPNLDVDPFTGCAATGHCRCQPGNTARTSYAAENNLIIAHDATINGGGFNLNTAAKTYFPHAPWAGQSPYMRTYRRLCVQNNALQTGASWFDTNIWVATVHACLDDINDIANIDPASDFRCTNQATNNNLFLINNAHVADTEQGFNGDLGDFFYPDGTAVGATTATTVPGWKSFEGETLQMRTERLRRTTCCGNHGKLPAVGGGETDVQLGICIDKSNGKADCCGARPYNPNTEKCCSRLTSQINGLDQPCPCTTTNNIVASGINRDCNFQGANVFVTNDHTTATGTTDWQCCGMSKFSEFNTLPQKSYCYHPTDITRSGGWRCCDDGNIYDPGTQQCCPINGLQSANVPCPCGADSDCPAYGGPQRCCYQLFPPGFARGQGAQQCSKYANWPRYEPPQVVGTEIEDLALSIPANPRVQRCPGTCFSSSTQICCNGRVCQRQFERCCNSTCCNRFSEGCIEGRRAGSVSGRYNPKDFHVWFETCTAKEHMSARKAFFIFVLPLLFLFATLLSLALVTVLARRATEHIFELTERAMVFFAVLAVLVSCAFFFSPLYKNGLAIAFVCLGAILIAVARKKKASLFLVLVLFFLIMYVIDPFGGNPYLSLSSAVPLPEAPKSSSLFESAHWLWARNQDCCEYYQYFQYDNNARDLARHSNPEQRTFGYCSRAWITTLMVLAALLYIFLLLLLLLAIFSFVKKLGMKPVEPVELEVAYEEAVPIVQPPVFIPEPAPIVAPIIAEPAPIFAADPMMGSGFAPMY